MVPTPPHETDPRKVQTLFALKKLAGCCCRQDLELLQLRIFSTNKKKLESCSRHELRYLSKIILAARDHAVAWDINSEFSRSN
jgi:hypothetical protein